MIEKSVGRAGANGRNDTLIVQCALNVARAHKNLPLISIDGIVGPITIGAITAFQQSNVGLVADGRVDPNGNTIKRLISFIGGEEFAYGPVVEALLDIKEQILRVSPINQRRKYRQPVMRLMPNLNKLEGYRDIAKGSPNAKSMPVMAFNKVTPKFGFAGVDDLAEAVALLAMAAIIVALFYLIISNPEFRKAVSVRARELDRILKALQMDAGVSLEENVNIVIDILTDSQDQESVCRRSPTFKETAACVEAINKLRQTIQKMKDLVKELKKAWAELDNYRRNPHAGFDVFKLRKIFDKILKKAQDISFEVQMDVADMKLKCNCP